MKSKISILLCSLFLFTGLSLSAQKKNKPPKNPQKTALKKEEAEAKELDRKIKKLKKEHRKNQGKKTAKRMKSQKKRSNRHSVNKRDPFLQRLFRKKNHKKVREKSD